MMPLCVLEVEFFKRLEMIDAHLAAAVAAARCPHCQGPLHQANYVRKPRGGLLCGDGEKAPLRHSLCCGRRGCRRRVLPPSLRFLGRRVYLGAVVLLASALALAANRIKPASDTSGVPLRCIQRWCSWWTDTFAKSNTWTHLRASFAAPTIKDSELPLSLFERVHAMQGRDPPWTKTFMAMAWHLAPATTTTKVTDTTRILRGVFAHLNDG